MDVCILKAIWCSTPEEVSFVICGGGTTQQWVLWDWSLPFVQLLLEIKHNEQTYFIYLI